MTSRAEQSNDEAEERVRRIHDAAIELSAGLIRQECKPAEVAGGLLSASLALFANLSSTDEVRRMLHRLADGLIGVAHEPPKH
ncbi:MAG: hypothetical protein R3F24_05120 [Gammaproteobacteria bacterium]